MRCKVMVASAQEGYAAAEHGRSGRGVGCAGTAPHPCAGGTAALHLRPLPTHAAAKPSSGTMDRNLTARDTSCRTPKLTPVEQYRRVPAKRMDRWSYEGQAS